MRLYRSLQNMFFSTCTMRLYTMPTTFATTISIKKLKCKLCTSAYFIDLQNMAFPGFIWSRHGTPPRCLLWPHQMLALPRLWPRRTLSLSPLQLSQLSLRLPLLLLRRRAYQAAAERCYWARARVRRARCRAVAARGGDRPRAPAARRQQWQ